MSPSLGVLRRGSATARPQALGGNPFPGGRPFKEGEADRFEGRTIEIAELVSIVQAHQVVLLHAPSGAGKSSLIQAGLIPALRLPADDADTVGEHGGDAGGEDPDRDVEIPAGRFDVLGVTTVHPGSLREGGHWPAKEDVPNVYTAAAVQFLTGRRERQPTLRGHLENRPSIVDEFGDPVPRLLVIDQFEEILEPFGRTDWLDCRDHFFDELAGVVGGDPPLHVLLAIREDHLATIEWLSSRAGLRFGGRYRLDKLRRPSALRAMEKPAERSGLPFAPGVAPKLLDKLGERRVVGVVEKLPGEFIEPAELQVVCRRLWSDAARAEPDADGNRAITQRHVDEMQGVEGALREHYEHAVGDVSRWFSLKSETAVRRFFEHQLISDGTRQLVPQNQPPRRKRDRVPPAAFARLEDEHNLIRTERRGGVPYWELSHDGFITPVVESNHDYFSARRREQLQFAAVLAIGLLVVLAWVFLQWRDRTSSTAPSALERFSAPIVGSGGVAGTPDGVVDIGERGRGTELTVQLVLEAGVDAELRLVDDERVPVAATADAGTLQGFRIEDDGEYVVEVEITASGAPPPVEVPVLVRTNSAVVTVPDVLGMPDGKAAATLTDAGLDVSLIAASCYQPAAGEPPAVEDVIRVIDAERAATPGGVLLDFNATARGEEVFAAEGTTVTIDTYNGQECLTLEAFDAVGMSSAAAEQALVAAGFSVAHHERLVALTADCGGQTDVVRGVTIFGPGAPEAPLVPGERLREGTDVTLWVTTECRSPAAVLGVPADVATTELAEAGFAVTDVRDVCGLGEPMTVRRVVASAVRPIGSIDRSTAVLLDDASASEGLVVFADDVAVHLEVSTGEACVEPLPMLLGADFDIALRTIGSRVELETSSTATCADGQPAVVSGLFDAAAGTDLQPTDAPLPAVADGSLIRVELICP